MNPRQELESIIEFKGGSGLNKGERIDKFVQRHAGKIGAGAGAAGVLGLLAYAKHHGDKQKKWAATAGNRDYLQIGHDLVLDKHGAMMPAEHPSVKRGNIHQLSARQQLDRIINFDMSTQIADKLGKVAWDKMGGAALKWGGTGAIAGAATGGITGAMDGDPIGGAMRGAVGGAVLGAGGAAMHEAGAFNHIIGTVEERAAKAAARKLAQTTEAAAPAAKQAAAAAKVPKGRQAQAEAMKARSAAPPTDELKGSFSGNPAESNTSVADAIAADKARTARARGIADMYGAKGNGVKSSSVPPQGQARTQAIPDQPRSAAALQAQQPAQQPVSQPSSNPQSAPSSSSAPKGPRFGSADEAVRSPVNEDVFNNLAPNVQKRARGVAAHYNTGADPSAGARYHAMRERYGFSARHALDSIIQMSMEEPTERTKRASKENWAAKIDPKVVRYGISVEESRRLASEAIKEIKKIGKTALSARDQLNLITLGVDANGKLHNSKGEFGGDNDAVAHPTAMRMTYGKALGIAATTGTTGGIAGVSAKALFEKLKGLKRK